MQACLDNPPSQRAAPLTELQIVSSQVGRRHLQQMTRVRHLCLSKTVQSTNGITNMKIFIRPIQDYIRGHSRQQARSDPRAWCHPFSREPCSPLPTRPATPCFASRVCSRGAGADCPVLVWQRAQPPTEIS
jgi:hypothetical protein